MADFPQHYGSDWLKEILTLLCLVDIAFSLVRGITQAYDLNLGVSKDIINGTRTPTLHPECDTGTTNKTIHWHALTPRGRTKATAMDYGRSGGILLTDLRAIGAYRGCTLHHREERQEGFSRTHTFLRRALSRRRHGVFAFEQTLNGKRKLIIVDTGVAVVGSHVLK